MDIRIYDHFGGAPNLGAGFGPYFWDRIWGQWCDPKLKKTHQKVVFFRCGGSLFLVSKWSAIASECTGGTPDFVVTFLDVFDPPFGPHFGSQMICNS